MLEHTATVLEKLTWSRRDVIEFVGRYLTEPKNNVVFKRPLRRAKRVQFERQAARRGIHLSAESRMLFYGDALFLNGEAFTPGRSTARLLAELANTRELVPPLAVPARAWQLLYPWYLAGYIAPGPIERAADE
jgi:50S ribosomal protein L16 3-hydroxylase